MTTIPDDIMRVADNIANERFALGLRVENVQELSDAIANAILAERERCAQIADGYELSFENEARTHECGTQIRNRLFGQALTALHIAAAIRKGSD
jgi:hypothetical protein